MSEHDKLIENLRDTLYFVPGDTSELCNSAADAIEVLESKLDARCSADNAAQKPLSFFDQNVDAWGAAEWFDRLAKAVRGRNAAVVAKEDLQFETCNNVASSSASRLVMDFEAQVRAALRNEPQAAPELTATCQKLLPGGIIDDATYAEIEDALDRADAPAIVGGQWLKLHERIAALTAERPAASAEPQSQAVSDEAGS